MPRTLNIFDQLLNTSFETKQRTKAFETGLLIAHQGAKVDTVLRLIPTPTAEDGKPATALDSDWVLSHAKAVSRMLPGGIVVLGVYVLAPNAKLSTMEPRLQLLLGSLGGKEPVVLLFPTDAKKPSARCLLPDANRLQPLEIRTTREAASLRCFACDLQLDAAPLRLSRAV